MFHKNNIESSPQEIWIRIRFLEINGSPSMVLIKYFTFININSLKLRFIINKNDFYTISYLLWF